MIINMVTMEFIENLDRIYIFQKGHLTEQGRPQDLILESSTIFYREMKTIAPTLLKELESKLY